MTQNQAHWEAVKRWGTLGRARYRRDRAPRYRVGRVGRMGRAMVFEIRGASDESWEDAFAKADELTPS